MRQFAAGIGVVIMIFVLRTALPVLRKAADAI
jgi:hypothetical protein